jgi:uncharacterized protein (TIGR00369 family)
MYCEGTPHNRALGLRILEVDGPHAVIQLDWQERLVGNPETGVLHGGAITALLDSCCGLAVASVLTDPQPFATLDLRIDYLRPATPRQAVVGDAQCYKLTANVAFVRAFAYHTDKADPIAAASGTFMLATQGQSRIMEMAGAAGNSSLSTGADATGGAKP